MLSCATIISSLPPRGSAASRSSPHTHARLWRGGRFLRRVEIRDDARFGLAAAHANRNRMRAASLLKLLRPPSRQRAAARLPPFSNRNMRIRPSFKNLATLWATCSLGGLIFTWRAYRAANAPESPLDAVIVPGGGLDERGEPWPWVKARLDAALRHDATTRQYLVLSRGTTTSRRRRTPTALRWTRASRARGYLHRARRRPSHASCRTRGASTRSATSRSRG